MKLQRIKQRIQESLLLRSIRQGLTLAIPFLILGSLALLIKNFPSAAYQDFLSSWLDGGFSAFLVGIYDISLGVLALILCLTISGAYGALTGTDEYCLYPLVALISYLAFCGNTWLGGENIFGAVWVFTAMCITAVSCKLFHLLTRVRSKIRTLYTIGAGYYFNLAMENISAIGLIVVLFALLGQFLRAAFGNANITNFGSYFFVHLFDSLGDNLFSTSLYILVSHALWFLGIHGTNTLEAVSQNLFESNVLINQEMLAAGSIPTEIFSKTFLDVFVFMGGCGTALCLVIALYLASRRRHNKRLSLLSLPFALFNISEIVIFGFPVILNPAMLLPFLFTPLVLAFISATAMHLGLVPVVTQSVGWTVPLLFSGYQATGSISGSILQLINLCVGVGLYIPFIRLSERRQAEELQRATRHIEADVARSEQSEIPLLLLSNRYPHSYFAKTLAADLKAAVAQDELDFFYQPQVSADGSLHGIEALLRWKHPVIGFISPPTLIRLAQEMNIMTELTYHLMARAYKDATIIEPHLSHPIFLSINISPKDMDDAQFASTVLRTFRPETFTKIRLVLELTERTVTQSESLMEKYEFLRANGVEFSIDDFGMGHSSMVRLQQHSLDEIKLDGNLVTQLTTNERSREIVAGIIELSKRLNNRVVAEFVETKEQRDLLEALGCVIYQGYYYSRPLDMDSLLAYIEEEQHIK